MDGTKREERVSGGWIGAKASQVAVIVAIIAAGLVAVAGPAGADQVIVPGTVVPLTNQGPDLARPADGRLRGIALSDEVTGIGFVTRADLGDAGVVSAATGDQLVLSSYQVQLHEATLAYFSPDPVAPPPGRD
jgi:hypothetical protein